MLFNVSSVYVFNLFAIFPSFRCSTAHSDNGNPREIDIIYRRRDTDRDIKSEGNSTVSHRTNMDTVKARKEKCT